MVKDSDRILPDVLGNALNTDALEGYSKEWDINGEKVTLSVNKDN